MAWTNGHNPATCKNPHCLSKACPMNREERRVHYSLGDGRTIMRDSVPILHLGRYVLGNEADDYAHHIVARLNRQACEREDCAACHAERFL